MVIECEHCGGSGVDPDSPRCIVSDCLVCDGEGEVEKPSEPDLSRRDFRGSLNT